MATLDWIGKKAVVNHHKEVGYHLLKCDAKRSVGEAGSGNLLVQGDNLLALKALLPYYAGQVKCIYIDPPYNTGNEKWVYNDNVNNPDIINWLGKTVGKETEDLTRHSKWMCMMYPRLRILWDLLSDEGAIFISIDDDEAHYLKVMIDEIFDRNNFVAAIIWQKKFSPQSDSKYFSDMHDYILVYARKKEIWKRNLMERTEENSTRYKNFDNDPRGPWTSSDMTVRTYSQDYDYPIKTPSGKIFNPTKGRSWSMPKESFKNLVQDNRIWFGKKGDGVPRVKKFLKEVQQGVVPVTLWLHNDVGHNQEATQEVKKILHTSGLTFTSPKPTRLLKRIIQIATDKNSLVLDSFAGSGTTGHAVLQLNKEDGGNRKFILVEMDKEICLNITYERVSRVINGYKYLDNKKNENNVKGLGGGFRLCSIEENIFDSNGQICKKVNYSDLARHIFFTETGEPLPKDVSGKRTPSIGIHKETAYYLLFNGILGDKSVDGGNVLTGKVLGKLGTNDGPRVVFGEGCRLGKARLKREGITFKQIPYEIKVS